MPATNFDLAPPAKVVDGLLAVPLDIQRITATLLFDGATASGSGDATLDFITGLQAGNPIFDLRQTLTAAWLDGAAFPIGSLAQHDFGGGANAQLRIAEAVLLPGTAHTLRVTYTLGPPQASNAGLYQPAMTWSAGPRLAFNFGFTDLGAGRYLEAWVPANLIYDQFELVLELRIVNTPHAHEVITNGTVNVLGTNHWQVTFPARFTALSPLLELRAADTLAHLADTTTLPVSGTTVTVEAWKLTSNAVDLTAQIANLKSWLGDNENYAGPYLHGNRFVAFLHVGGMEYEGGTTANAGSLNHEAFHSWWARGLKPASQPDAWWDEAWTVYHDNGGGISTPFQFTDPPVELCPRNPWVRITASASYSSGNRFFEGLSALVGNANLRQFLKDFYNERKARPATTTDLETYLLCRAGEASIVDAFHRFVYGFANPSPAPDLWLRDDPAHTGGDAWAGPFWDSPDLWIRNVDDDGVVHQPPEFGQDNWFYARVRNRAAMATARHFVVAFNVKPYAGTEFVYPNDYLPCIAAAAGFELGPGQSTVVKARWPAAQVPAPGTHACWLAAVLARFDHPPAGRFVWEHNNLAQKNLTIVDLAPGDWLMLPFVIDNLRNSTTRRLRLELVRPRKRNKLKAFLVPFAPIPPLADGEAPVAPAGKKKSAVDCAADHLHPPIPAPTVWTSRTDRGRPAVADAERREFPPGKTARLPVVIGRHEQIALALRVEVPRDAQRDEELTLHLVQRAANDRTHGGIAVRIRVR